MKKTFIEIGACDFDNNDDLLDSGWRGIFVEPIWQYYNNLARKVQGKDATIVRAAITDFDGTIKMETIPNCAETWIRGISHISTDTLHNTASGLVKLNAPDTLQVVEVPAMTLDTLLTSHDVTDIDFMQIDVEGHGESSQSFYVLSTSLLTMVYSHLFSNVTAISTGLREMIYTEFLNESI
jgi:FkbM family methyltransferase